MNQQPYNQQPMFQQQNPPQQPGFQGFGNQPPMHQPPFGMPPFGNQPFNPYNPYNQQEEKSTWWIWLVVVGVLSAIGVGIYLFLKNKASQVVNLTKTTKKQVSEIEPDEPEEIELETKAQLLQSKPIKKSSIAKILAKNSKNEHAEFARKNHVLEGNIAGTPQTINYFLKDFLLKQNGYYKSPENDSVYRSPDGEIDVEITDDEIIVFKGDKQIEFGLEQAKYREFNEQFIYEVNNL